MSVILKPREAKVTSPEANSALHVGVPLLLQSVAVPGLLIPSTYKTLLPPVPSGAQFPLVAVIAKVPFQPAWLLITAVWPFAIHVAVTPPEHSIGSILSV